MDPACLAQCSQVYFVQSTDDPAANPVAIRPAVYENRIEWGDTAHGKVLVGAHVDNLADVAGQAAPDVIKITARDQKHYTLIKLTLEIYNKSVRDIVAEKPEFPTTEALQKHYLTL